MKVIKGKRALYLFNKINKDNSYQIDYDKKFWKVITYLGKQ